VNIGLVDSIHTRADGYKYSSTSFSDIALNESDQSIGYSFRFLGGDTQLGQTAWFYDPVLNHTTPLVLSTRSDGFAFSTAEYLGEDGLVLGSYSMFDSLDNDLGERLFYFTLADGLHDLGSLVQGGLSANGWNHLAELLRANGMRQILGHGLLTSQTSGQMPYLLTLQSAVELPGDYNDDGFVNAADYTVWRNNLGAPAGTLPNDVDGGAISQAHYETWRVNFGELLGTGASDLNSLTVVPEPTTFAMLLFACLPLLRRKHR
jgi:hypothetical protein